MLNTLVAEISRASARAGAALEKALGYLLDYGLPALLLTCLLTGVILLVWAHWAVG